MFNDSDYFMSLNPLDRYRLFEQLGKGAYGEVCRAVNAETGETVALKQPTQVGGDIFKRFRNEVEFYRRMSDSPFILKMSDSNVGSRTIRKTTGL